jgi:phage shock protein E
MIKKATAIIIFSLVIGIAAMAQDYRDLFYKEFLKKAHDTKGVVIDARTPTEYEAGHLPNSVLIDFNAADFIENIGKLDRESHYFLYCRTGNRTGKALLAMQALGFKNVYHLKGGVMGIEQANVLVKD